jgi:SAM-dependent methyltransferase
MRETLKALFKGNRFTACAAYVLLDRLQLVTSKLGYTLSNSGTTHLGKSVDESLAYIESVYAHYARYWPVGVSGRAAELGPGDNCGTALLLRASLARGVDLVDRFYSRRASDQQAVIYGALVDKYPEVAALCRNAVSPGERDFDDVMWHTGEEAAAERFFATRPATYSFIASCAVLGLLFDPLRAIEDMAAALVPGGAMVHVIDLRDHGMFSQSGLPELEWLTIPDAVWPLMTRGHGRPNRVNLEAYRDKCHDLGLETSIGVMSLAGAPPFKQPVRWEDLPTELMVDALAEVAKVKGRLCRSYQRLEDRALAVTGITLHAVKRR